jgi:hypothetical protein
MTMLGFPLQPFVMFGPFRTPGVAFPRKPGSPRTWDIRQQYGASGAVVVYTGAGLAKFNVEVVLWLPEHFVEWEIFARGALAKPIPGLGAGAAMGIGHPLVNMAPWNIQSVVIEDVEGFEQNDLGKWSTIIHCIEYRKPLPAIARPIAAIPAVEAPVPTAQDAAEIKMQQLAAQAKALGG